MSEDCKVDEELLLTKLNELNWCNEDREWTFENKGFWYADRCQYPTVCFTHPVTLNYTNESGNIQSVPYADATEEQFDAIYDTDDEEVPLSAISEFFNDCIVKGSITIAATSNEKARYVKYEALTIYSDMCVEYDLHFVGTSPDYSTSHKHEEYSLGD